MQVSTHSFQPPQYESALLKKQRQSKVLSPKVTHVYPEISSIQKIKLKKHHLDDTEMKMALQYDYEENHLPKQYLFKADQLDYDKKQYNTGKNSNRRTNTQNSSRFPQGSQTLNTEYFENQNNFKPMSKPERDINQDPSHRHFQHHFNTQNKQKQKSACSKQDLIGRYRSQGKGSSAEKKFGKLKEKLERERTKEKMRLEQELDKIKQETRKIKQQEKKRMKNFKQIMQKQQPHGSKYLQNLMISPRHNNGVHYNTNRTSEMHYVSQRTNPAEKTNQGQNDPLIYQKITQLERKYLPKTNIVNKRIQCDIYDPRSDRLRWLQNKPRFKFNQESDTDSQFSDF